MNVNAHFGQAHPTEAFSVVDAVYVRAVDETSSCCNTVGVRLDNCSLSLNGVSDVVLASYQKLGVSIDTIDHGNKIRIGAANCDGLKVAVWVDCQTKSMRVDSGSQLRETAHGLMGQ